MSDSDPMGVYLDILLQQYSETWETIRNDSNAVWQIPTLLLTVISVLGLAYIQLPKIRIEKVSVLLVVLGFSIVSLLALIKHRASCNYKTEEFEDVQKQLMRLLEQEKFKSWFKEINKDVAKDKTKIQFREIKFRREDIATKIKPTGRFDRYQRWFYRRSAYNLQLVFTVLVTLGIASLFAYELYLLLL